MERLELGRRSVRAALWPTAIEETAPWARQGAYSRLVRFALGAVRLGRDLCPEGRPERFRGPGHARVSEARRTLSRPVPPGLLAPAFRDRCDAGILWAFRGGGEAFPWCAAGDEEARSQDGPGPWQGVKQGAVGRSVGTRGTGSGEVGQGWHGHAEWGDQGLYQEGLGADHAGIRGPCHRVLEGFPASRDEVGRAPVGGTAKARQGGATCEVGGWQSRPAAEDVATDRRSGGLQPLQDVGAGGCERTRQAMRQPACVADEAPAVCHEWRQGAPLWAWRATGGEFVTGGAQARDLECGLGGGIFGATRGKRCAGRGHGPVEVHQGGTCFGDVWLHGGSPSV